MAREENAFSQNAVQVTREENAAFCKYAIDVFNFPAVDLTDAKAVEQAIDNYFLTCADRGIRPGNLGLYAALGLSKQDVSNAIRGYSKRLSPPVIDLLKKAKTALGAYREALGSAGKINPVTLIFWQKNFDGLEDRQAVDFTARNDLQPQLSESEVAARIEKDIPIDADFTIEDA